MIKFFARIAGTRPPQDGPCSPPETAAPAPWPCSGDTSTTILEKISSHLSARDAAGLAYAFCNKEVAKAACRKLCEEEGWGAAPVVAGKQDHQAYVRACRAGLALSNSVDGRAEGRVEYPRLMTKQLMHPSIAPQLTSLSLHSEPLHPAILQSTLENFPNVTRLSVAVPYGFTDRAETYGIIAHYANAQNLQHLRFNGCSVEHPALEALLQQLPSLRALELHYAWTIVGPGGQGYYRPHCPQLERLYLASMGGWRVDDSLWLVEHMPHLTALEMPYMSFEGAALETLQGLSALQSLKIRGKTISKTTSATALGGVPWSITELACDYGTQSSTPLETLPNLRTLEVTWGKLPGLDASTQLKALSSLRSLAYHGEFQANIPPMPHLTQLRWYAKDLGSTKSLVTVHP